MRRVVRSKMLQVALATIVGVPAAVGTGSAPAAHAIGGPVLVDDINLDGEGSQPSDFTVAGSTVYFTADDGSRGRELWMSDNGAAPELVADLHPTGSSNPAELFAAGGGLLYFSADDGATGRELWRTDGTAAGTIQAADIYAGTGSGSPEGFVNYAGFTYFSARTSAAGQELWRTDGTAGGTTLAADVWSGTTSSEPEELTVVDHGPGDRRLWMRARAGDFDSSLVVYDAPEGATADVTVELLDGQNPTELTALAGDLYAAAGDYPNRVLYRVERTAVGPPATYAATDLGGSSPNGLTVMSGDLYLANGVTTTSDQELHVLNGNSIDLVTEINIGSGGAGPGNFTATGGSLYFTASDGAAHSNELWRSDGTALGTVMVADIAAGNLASFATPVVANGGALFFAADDHVTGRELWFTRASDGAVFQVDDLFPGAVGSYPTAGVLSGTHVYLGAADREHGDEVMRIDVSTPVVAGVTDVAAFGDLAPGTTGSNPYGPIGVGEQVLFSATTLDTGGEPWLFDPATHTAGVLTDLVVGAGSSWPTALADLGDVAVFSASTSSGYELWVTDGTPGGTAMIDLDGSSSAVPQNAVRSGDYLYFSAHHSTSGRELWRTDGTPAGTVLLADAEPGPVDGDPDELTPFGDGLAFVIDGDLWVSDGSPTGTHPLDDGPGTPTDVRDVGAGTAGALMFAAAAPANPSEQVLWTSDGTPSGTMAIETTPQGNPRYPEGFARSGDTVFFSAYDGGNYRAWATDGTAAGTRPITNAPTEPYSDDYAALAGGGVAFVGYDPAYGSEELWVSDGTLAGTRPVDLEPGAESSYPSGLVSVRGWVYFTADVAAAGRELWRTDGTTTQRLTDLNPGPADSFQPYSEAVTPIGHELYVVADDGVTGEELWVMADAPDAPLGVSASPAVGTATVSWSPAVGSVLAPVTGYTATAEPGGATCAATGTSCSVVGLTPGTSYTITVVAHSGVGDSPASAPSNAVVPLAPASPGADDPIVPVEPARYLDTRDLPTFDGQHRNEGRQAAGSTRRVQIAGRGGVPSGASGVVANLTVAGPSAAGHATLFPCTPAPPNASHLNYLPGDVLANNAVVPLDATGGVCIYSRAEADYILDVNGFTPAGSALTGVEPARYLDTRQEANAATFDGAHLGGGAIPAEQSVEIPIAGRGAVPAGAAAAFVTVTAVTPQGPGYLTLYDCGTRPLASSVNYAAGQVVPNSALVELSAAGMLCVFSKAASHVLVDVAAYVPAGTGGLTAATPERLLDTRPGGPTVDGQYSGAPDRLVADEIIEIQVAGRGSVPAGATAALLNVALVAPDAPGYATLYPCGTRPTASNVNNLVPGSVRANNALTKLSPTGTVCIYVKAGTDLIVDSTGWTA